MATQWCEPKPYPPTVATMISELPIEDALSIHSGFQHTVTLLHDWCWTQSDALDEDLRILLRFLKAAVRDCYLLGVQPFFRSRTAVLTRLNRPS